MTTVLLMLEIYVVHYAFFCAFYFYINITPILANQKRFLKAAYYSVKRIDVFFIEIGIHNLYFNYECLREQDIPWNIEKNEMFLFSMN